ncbi:MAG: AAA family ATPase, partial [Chloroflexota bacterium]
YVLSRFLQFFERSFDFILKDCPANRGLLTVNALTAADLLVVPIETTPAGLQASRSMLEHPRFLPSITGRSWLEEMRRMAMPVTQCSTLLPNRRSSLANTAIESSISGGDEGDNEEAALYALALEESRAQVVYPNPRLRIGAIVPFRYDPAFKHNQEVLGTLSTIFGSFPLFDKQARRYCPDPADDAAREGRPVNLLMPPVGKSATYQRSFSRSADVAELNKRFAPLWDYVAAHLLLVSCPTPTAAAIG